MALETIAGNDNTIPFLRRDEKHGRQMDRLSLIESHADCLKIGDLSVVVFNGA